MDGNFRHYDPAFIVGNISDRHLKPTFNSV